MMALGGLDKTKHDKVLTHINSHEDIEKPHSIRYVPSKLPTNSHFSFANAISN
jgi:hypothetical protein